MTVPLPAALVALKSTLGEGGWTEDPAEIAPWLTEWRNRWHGHSPLMLTPRSTAQVAAAIRVCAEHRIAIVPQGGDTGLVGGQIPFGEVLLSTRKLRAVRDVTPLDDAMTVEAGITLLEAQQAAAAADRLFPLSLAAEGHGHHRRGHLDQCRRHRRAPLRHDARSGAGHRGGHARRRGLQRPQTAPQGQHRL